MIPTYQTIFTPPSGNCFAACVASILERPLWTVPNFVMNEDWWDPIVEWCKKEKILLFGTDDLTEDIRLFLGHGYGIGVGPSHSGDWNHCVVIDLKTYGIVHDPNPKNLGIKGYIQELILMSPLP